MKNSDMTTNPESRKVYVYPSDGYLGEQLCKGLLVRGFSVLAGHHTECPADGICCSYQIGSSVASATKRQFLAIADIVIYELHGHEQAARDAVVHMAKQPFGGRQQLFIGVSTPLVWSGTRPAPPAAATIDEDQDIPDSASAASEPLGRLGASQGGAATPATVQPGTKEGQINRSRPTSADLLNASQDGTGTKKSSKDGQGADMYSLAVAHGALTDRDAGRRAPCFAVREVHELEQLVVRCQRKNKLRTAVVCPGLLYGQGNSDSVLHPILKSAWELAGPLTIYGSGNNFLPMMHVNDCAAYLVALCGKAQALPAGSLTGSSGGAASSSPPVLMAGLPDTMQYLLAVDSPSLGQPGGVQQGDLIREISARLGTGVTQTVPPDELLFVTGVEQWSINAAFACTPLPPECGYEPKFCSGILANLDAVLQEWRDVRAVNALRIVMSGPPMAGKSTIASRLASQYGLAHITAKDIISAVDHKPPEDAKAVQQELSGKEGRASARSMSLLLRAWMAANKSAVNRGYVMDAYPKTATQARWAFLTTVPLSAEELAEKQREEESLRASTLTKGGKLGAAGAAAAAGGVKKDGKGKAAGDGPDVPDGQKLVPDPLLAPTHLIQVDAEPDHLSSRRVAVEAAEQEAARLATPDLAATSGKAAAAAKAGKGSAIQSHNNEKDFARRVAAWQQILTDEQQDLESQIAAATAKWERQQAEKEEARLKAEAESRTLRARRARAKQEAAAAATLQAQSATLDAPSGSQQELDSTQAASTIQQGVSAPSVAVSNNIQDNAASTVPTIPNLLTALHPENAAITSNGDTNADDSEQADPTSTAGPVLPKYGGLTGVLVNICGTQYLRVQNLDCPTGPHISSDAWEVETVTLSRQLSKSQSIATAGSLTPATRTPRDSNTPVDVGNTQGPGEEASPPVANPLRQLDLQIKDFLGPPRNFTGFPVPCTDQQGSNPEGGKDAASRAGTAQTLQQQHASQQDEHPEQVAKRLERLQQQVELGGSNTLDSRHMFNQRYSVNRMGLLQAARRDGAAARTAQHKAVVNPVQQYIMSRVMPCVTEALRLIAVERPEEPLRYLAHHLLAEADQMESVLIDPYTDPVYDQQRSKAQAKKERDEAREKAAAEKAEKDLAMKQATRQASLEPESSSLTYAAEGTA